ncbi:sensor histidine kinase [Pedobacter foliorum]|uniref:sensor histidine kinase n=1 Tax=Pedobacter foliorum TaxID=2739058 RepID=UPI0015660852|nr:histidine kinase [Pedobacter foliorum]NRF37942.1 histidine kinase [Pedobacter foliorum]
MKTKLPVKSLVRISCCFSIAVSFFLMLSSFIEDGQLYIALQKSVFFILLMIMICLSNIGLLVIFRDEKTPTLSKCPAWFYVLSFAMSTVVILFIYWLGQYLSSHDLIFKRTPFKVKGNIIYLYLSIQGFVINAIALLLQNFIIVQDFNTQVQLENSRLIAARSQAANELLLQQIHPHFLFNALNILKSLIKRSPEKAEDYLIRLSDFLRVSISTNKTGIAPLHDELKLCADYLEMQKVRFGDALRFNLDIQEEESLGLVLPVFSLQPLLENVIKHNELTDAAPLNITIRQDGKWISVINNIQLKSNQEYSTGSGLANLAERYNLLSGDEVDIRDDGLTFSVSLKILKHEDCNYRR